MNHDLSSQINKIANDLTGQGWAYTDQLFDLSVCTDLSNEINSLRNKEELRKAEIGPSHHQLKRPEIRGDYIHWIDNVTPTSTQRRLLNRVMELASELAKRLLFAFNAFEAHYAYYPQETSYKKHLDCFKSDDSRFLSVILYLNPNWQTHHGGQLRIFNKENPHSIDTEIEPIMGRFVIFLSHKIYHEVLPTSHERYSVAGWIKNKIIQSEPLALVL